MHGFGLAGVIEDRDEPCERHCCAIPAHLLAHTEISSADGCRTSVSAQLRLTRLSRSRNQRADGDGCVGSHLDAAAGSRV